MKKIIFIFLILLITIFHAFYEEKTQTIIISDKIESYNNKNIPNNSDIIGRIKIENTTIDYDLVKTTNNSYYLNHNSKKEEDKKGSIFMDYRNNLEDNKLLIYGHNSNNTTAPFKELEQYLNYDYYQEHKQISITLENKNYIYKIFSIMIVEEGDYRHTKISFTDEEYKNHLSWLKNSSIYKIQEEIKKQDKIITIQTCNYTPQNSYLLINAKRSI